MNEGLICRLPAGQDLLNALTSEFKNRHIEKASFSVIGAVTCAAIGFYDLVKRQYDVKAFKGHYEIVQCSGNVSLKDGEIFVHAHIVLAGADYQCFGGHLMSETRIFAAELSALPLPGRAPARQFDEQTGLYLWPMEQDA
jgi:predicted DNA-binding protein with PD1-like motif